MPASDTIEQAQDIIDDLTSLAAALRRSEERFRIAAENANDVVIEWNLTSGYVQYFGAGRPELPPRDGHYTDWIDRLHVDDRARVLEGLDAVMRDGAPFQSEHRLRDDLGAWRWVRVRGQCVADEAGVPARWIGTLVDVTAEHEAENRLRDALNLFEAVVEGSPQPIYVKNLDGQFLLANRAGAAVLGVEPADLIGKRSDQVLPPELTARLLDLEAQAVRERRAVSGEGEYPAANGGRHFVVTKAPFHNAAGEMIGTIALLHDITDRVRLEEEFRQAQKMEAIGRLAGGIAHDFNNLLTVILGYADELEFADDAEDRTAALRELIHAGERAAQLTAQLLAFSRRQVLQPEPTNLNDSINALGRMLERVVGEDIRIRTILDPALGTVRIDRGQFDQVMLNLVVNARDAMPHGGSLTIRSENLDVGTPEVATEGGLPRGRYVVLSVSDTGEGMDRETVSHIFEPFFTTKGHAGTGLGLSTAYGILKQSGGDIRVNSRKGRGTRFSIVLPRVDGEAEPTSPASPAVATAGSERILLVEDDDGARALISTTLRRRGYRVTPCRDSREALEAFASNSADLLVTDVVMPHGNGVDLAQEIRQRCPQTQVLLMSGYADHAALAGPDLIRHEFIQKPFTPSALAARVREILDVTARPA